MKNLFMSRKNIEYKRLLQELPYYGINFIAVHGQFNNSLSSCLTPKVYLNNLQSIYDLDLFSLNHATNLGIDPDQNTINNNIRCRYYSPNSFQKIKSDLEILSRLDRNFSVFHNNVRSLRKNLENLQTHVLDELDFSFSIIGITETRITNANLDTFNYDIPGYSFEFVPTPLAAGGVGMYIRDDYRYYVIEKTSNEAFQALWVEIILPSKKNIICCTLYRQHRNPESFLQYCDEKFEAYSSKDSPIIILGDTNIDLLKVGDCNYAHNFLLSQFTELLSPPLYRQTYSRASGLCYLDRQYFYKQLFRYTNEWQYHFRH